MSLKANIQDWSARLGYPIIPSWRLHRLEQSAHLRRLLDDLHIDCILDVGANVGQYHEFLRLHVGYSGAIVSFEPVHRLFEKLQEASTTDPRWSVHCLALGDIDSVGTINVLHAHQMTSFLSRDEAGLLAMGYDKYLRQTEVDYTEVVPIRRLDAILHRILPHEPARVFLKTDTQGYDMSVVRGAEGCLDRIAAMQVELSVRRVYVGAPDFAEGIAELTALGYEITGLFPVQRDSSLRIVNLDCVMIRADEAERLRAGRPPIDES